MDNDIFKNAGKAAAVSYKGTKALVKFDEGKSYNIVLQSVDGLVSENFQAMKSFSDDTYVTTFGQALNQIRLIGIFLPDACPGATQGDTDLKGFYATNRVGKHKTLTVTFAGMTVKGFLIAIDIDPYIKDGFNSFRFTIAMLGQLVL